MNEQHAKQPTFYQQRQLFPWRLSSLTSSNNSGMQTISWMYTKPWKCLSTLNCHIFSLISKWKMFYFVKLDVIFLPIKVFDEKVVENKINNVFY
jgi:hypothetical protein